MAVNLRALRIAALLVAPCIVPACSGETDTGEDVPELSCSEQAVCPEVLIDDACSFCDNAFCTEDGSEPSSDDAAVRCTSKRCAIGGPAAWSYEETQRRTDTAGAR